MGVKQVRSIESYEHIEMSKSAKYNTVVERDLQMLKLNTKSYESNCRMTNRTPSFV